MTMRRTLAGSITMVVGVAFIAVTFSSRLFTAAPAFDDMTDDFRPLMTDQAISTFRSDLTAVGAVAEEYTTKVVPTMSGALGITPDEFNALTEQQWPAVATGVAALPTIGERFTTVANTLDTEQGRFASADAIPTADIPTSTVPGTMLALGIAIFVLGWLMLRPGRLVPTISLLLGAALVIGSLALSLPRKTGDADQLNANLRPVYTATLVEQGKAGLSTVTAMATQMQTEMLPALGERLNMTPEQVNAFVGEQFPAIAGALQNLPAVLQRFSSMVATFDANLENYDAVKDEAFQPVTWTMIGGGVLMVLVAGFAIGKRETEDLADVHLPRIHHRRKAA